MNHDHSSMTSSFSFPISEMTLMWILMGIMAVHHFWMWKKMKNSCTCGDNKKSKENGENNGR